MAALAAAMALDGLGPAIRQVTQARAARAAYARLGALLEDAPRTTVPTVALKPDLILRGTPI
ncbi:hypothetical protein, partial [Clostridium perfringens]